MQLPNETELAKKSVSNLVLKSKSRVALILSGLP